jgi:hypothetical protein
MVKESFKTTALGSSWKTKVRWLHTEKIVNALSLVYSAPSGAEQGKSLIFNERASLFIT